MKKVAIILADGFEEIEAITTIDILRRATIDVEIVSLRHMYITGAHGVILQADDVFDYYGLLDLDGIVFAGGMGNANTLAEDSNVIKLIEHYDANNKLICGICATPAIVFSKTGILEGKEFTCYPDDDLIGRVSDGVFVDKSVVVSGNVITSQSPHTSFVYALTIVKQLGYDIDELQKNLKGSK